MEMPLECRELLLGRVRAGNDQRQRIAAFSLRDPQGRLQDPAFERYGDHIGRRIEQGSGEAVEFHLPSGCPRLGFKVLERH
ncbi:hypothetical protein D3C71_2131510 [compost metagenome]